jgi:hypothetical protein
VGFSNAATLFALHVPWLLLCKNCSRLGWAIGPTASLTTVTVQFSALKSLGIRRPQRRSPERHAHLTSGGSDAKFCNANPNKRGARSLASNDLKSMIKTPATLAKQMERAIHRAGKDCFLYENEHCALFENDLKQICPRNDKDRKKKLAEFAAQYGFRLRFYHEGLFAIFDKRMPPVPNDAGAFWPPVACQASSMK